MIGVPTGFADLDRADQRPAPRPDDRRRRPGPAIGKALALDTPLPTPTGWTTMGEVAVGDQLLGADGRPTTVVAATEVHDRPAVLRGRVLRRLGDRRRRRAPVADRDRRAPPVRCVRRVRDDAGAAPSTVRVDRAGEARPNHRVAEPACAASSPDAGPAGPAVPPRCRGRRCVRRRRRAGPRAGAARWTRLAVAAGGLVARQLDRQPVAAPTTLRAAEPQRRALLAGLLDTDGDGRRRAATCRYRLRRPALAERRARAGRQPRLPCAATPGRVRGAPDGYTLTLLRRRRRLPARAQARSLHKRAAGRPRRRHRTAVIVDVRPVPQRAGPLRPGRQRRPPLPRRPVDDPDAQLDAAAWTSPAAPRSSTTWPAPSSRWR